MVFIEPPPASGSVGDYSADKDYALNSTMHITWEDGPEVAGLYLIKDDDLYTCDDLNRAKTWCYPIEASFNGASNGLDWIVQTYNHTYSTGDPIYYLWLASESSSNTLDGFISHYFNLYPQDLITASTSSAPIATPTPTSTSTPSATTTPSSSNPAASSSASSQLSPGNKAVIGIAIGVAIPLLILLSLIAFFLYRRRGGKSPPPPSEEKRPMKFMEQPEAAPAYTAASKQMSGYHGGYYDRPVQTIVQELHGSESFLSPGHPPSEMSADNDSHHSISMSDRSSMPLHFS